MRHIDYKKTLDYWLKTLLDDYIPNSRIKEWARGYYKKIEEYSVNGNRNLKGATVMILLIARNRINLDKKDKSSN